MKKWIVYLILVLLVLLLVGLVKFAFFPTSYRHGDWWEPFDRHLRKFDFANYELPMEYEMVTYRSSDARDQSLLLYKHKNSGQLLTLVIFREHPEVDFNHVMLENGLVKRAFWRTEISPARGNFFAVEQLLPFGWRDDIENAGNDVTIKGIQVTGKQTFPTEKTEVLYVNGEFDRLGFYKKSDNWRPFVTPALDFMGERKGAVAIINDKKTGKTLFAIGCNYKNAEFNEQEFRNIVTSLNFDATPLSEAFSNIKGLKKKTTVTTTGRRFQF